MCFKVGWTWEFPIPFSTLDKLGISQNGLEQYFRKRKADVLH